MNSTALITGLAAVLLWALVTAGAGAAWDDESAAREAVGRCYAAGGSVAQCEGGAER